MIAKLYSVMFHHFHDEVHLPAQGSLTASQLRDMIDWLDKNYSLIGANEYLQKFKNNILQDYEVCLSFDDALKCQYDIAFPILEEYKLDAFFFIYSSAFIDNSNLLEIYTYFRINTISNIDNFYKKFFQIVENDNPLRYSKHFLNFNDLNYLSSFPFYSENDKWFRYLRDIYLTQMQYHQVMVYLMNENNFDMALAKKILFMSEEDVKDIDKKGHTIGLHSFSHPTKMSKLNMHQQEIEYQKNYKHLSKLIGKPIKTMSHPCGSYNKDTLSILSKLNIDIGFRSSLSPNNVRSSLEIPREDQANIFKEMNK